MPKAAKDARIVLFHDGEVESRNLSLRILYMNMNLLAIAYKLLLVYWLKAVRMFNVVQEDKDQRFNICCF
ncbi:hypothetical protein Scep_012556 [Stephania cephalantha]|uniref:Uncharacterized protein n=1 Tax=Stephania cephalantha TaxID=152367 RepID=A0AAP0P6T6_9MAGN